METVYLNQIEDFFKQKSIAIVGLSRDEKDYTRNLFKALREDPRAFNLFPVNPNAEEIEGVKCYRSVLEIAPTPDAVMIFTVKASLETIVEECIEKGINHIWVHNNKKDTEEKDRIGKLCIGKGKNIIIDKCPFLFLEGSGFPHKLHGICLKIIGKYPSHKKEN